MRNEGKPARILMGPGPSNCDPSVLEAMTRPLLGHLDPEFLAIMDETQELLRRVMKTRNRLTLPVSGTGSAGMEACFVNLVEPGDRVLVCVNGVFGTRMADIVERIGGRLFTVEAEWGKPLDPTAVEAAARACLPKVLAVVHAETSTGVLQPIEPLGNIAREVGALFLVDVVTSLGGCNVDTDGWQVDAAYGGTQKCLSCPPGLAPLSFGSRALSALEARKTKVQSWYLDMTMVRKYWGTERTYHHTAPISMVYALNQALKLLIGEGLEARFKRHRLNHRALVAGLEALGLSMLVEAQYRAPMLNAVLIPEGVDDRKVRGTLLNDYNIEIGGGLGPLAGRTWRIGLMGSSCRPENVTLLLNVLERILKAHGVPNRSGAAAAAEAVYAAS
jgi:alanine-glyoxylate transaminase/serine-glyoxylate transaminase/serine-pyruvate transaminase